MKPPMHAQVARGLSHIYLTHRGLPLRCASLWSVLIKFCPTVRHPVEKVVMKALMATKLMLVGVGLLWGVLTHLLWDLQLQGL